MLVAPFMNAAGRTNVEYLAAQYRAQEPVA
jgi:hypothetical protein